jgi:hypothetical protein
MNSKLYKVLYVILVDNVSPPKEGEDELSKKMLGGLSLVLLILRLSDSEQKSKVKTYHIL